MSRPLLGGITPKETIVMSRQAWLFIAAIFLFAVGGCCLVQSDRVQEQADGLPRLACDQLIQNGPAGNNFLKLTDVSALLRGIRLSSGYGR
jgi:hypothetical protein